MQTGCIILEITSYMKTLTAFRLQEQVLEDRHADLEYELRTILAKQGR